MESLVEELEIRTDEASMLCLKEAEVMKFKIVIIIVLVIFVVCMLFK